MRGDRLLGLGLFAFCLVLYGRTAAPSLVFWGDGAELTLVAATLGVAHPTGYPLHTWLGFLFSRLLPWGDAAYRINLLSATLGAGSVAMLYLIARRVGLGRAVAATSAFVFGVSRTFWSQAIITELYAPNLFFVAVTLYLLLRWAERAAADAASGTTAFTLFALAYGLSLGTHMSNLGFAPAFALFILLTAPRALVQARTVLLGSVAFLAGIAQFAWLPLRAASTDLFPYVPPNTLEGFYKYTLGAFGPLQFAFPLTALPRRLAVYSELLEKNFSIAGIVLGLLGMGVLLARCPARFWLLMGMYGIHVVFFTQLGVPDLDPFFIPSHFAFALFLGFGIDAVYGALRRRFPPLAPLTTGLTALALLAVFIPIAASSVRDNDHSRDTVIPDFFRSVFAVVPSGSAILAGQGAYSSHIRYWGGDYYRLRPDVTVLSKPTRSALPREGPLFLVGPPVLTRREGPFFGLPRGILPPEPSYVTVLRGNRHELVLYRVEETPPPIVGRPPPDVRHAHSFADVTLVACEAALTANLPTPRLRFQTWWRAAPASRIVIATAVDDVPLETHELTFGDDTMHEDFEVVVPSTLDPGMHTVRIATIEFSATGLTPRWADVGEIVLE